MSIRSRKIKLQKEAKALSFIRCSENCVHQKDGYCEVDCVTDAVADVGAPCVYYEKKVLENPEKVCNNKSNGNENGRNCF